MGATLIEYARSYLPLHRRVYTGVMVLTVVSQFIWPTTWWFFWPLIIWTVIFMLHLMVIRTIDVQDDWVDERTDKLADNAFDYGHMDGIRKRIAKTTYGDAYGSGKDEKPPEK